MTLEPLSERLRKLTRSLLLTKHRDEEQSFIAEGKNVVQELLVSKYKVEFVVVRNVDNERFADIVAIVRQKGIPAYSATAREFEQLSDAKTPQGILAVAQYKKSDSPISSSFVALDGVTDPGNVGTIIRTAHFFGFNTILLGEGSVDIYNPKLVRSTMGSLFHCNIICCNLKDKLYDIRSSFDLYGTSSHAVTKMEECRPQKNFGVIIGNEAHGISKEIKDVVSELFVISGGGTESLNASVAAGISLYHFSKYIR